MTSPTLDRRQGLVGNTPIKAAVDCATTGAVTLSGEQIIDGFQTSSSRVLVWNQADPTQNGIYDSSSAAWTRSADADGNYDLDTNTLVSVKSGGQAGAFFALTTTAPIAIGTSALTWILSAGTSLGISLAGGTGPGLIGWLRAATSAVLTTLQSWMGWQDINAFEFMTVAQIADFQASTFTQDLTAPLQAWANACVGQNGRLPKGNGKTTAPISVLSGTRLRGHGTLSRITAYGCDAFHVAAGMTSIDFEDMALFGASSTGVADPRTFKGLVTLGVNGNGNNYINYKNLYLQGWQYPIENSYVFNSNLDNVTTVNCTTPLHLFGQCVGTVIVKSHLVANGGQAAIQTTKDVGGIQGEGLQIGGGTLLASGLNGLKSDGFLSVGLDASCIVDLCTGKAFDLSGVSVFKCDAQWVYSADTCFNFADQGSAVETNAHVNVGLMTCTGSATAVYWGTNNSGLRLGGSVYLVAGSGFPVSLNGTNADVRPYIKNGTAQAAVRVGSAGNTIEQTGDRSIEWDTSPIATVASAAALVLPRNGCKIFFISGTTNVTSMSAGTWAGQEVALIFQGVLTFTDGGNLKLAGNFVTTADDVLRLVSDGTSWYELSRSVN